MAAIIVSVPPPITWLKVLETGIAEIDKEHRHFIEQYSILTDLVTRRADRGTLLAAVHALVEQITQHFIHEEELLLRSHFPRYNQHLRAHRNFVRQFEMLVERMAEADEAKLEYLNLVAELGDVLIDLLFRHDLDYKSHLLHAVGR